jgi:hypothetical protein
MKYFTVSMRELFAQVLPVPKKMRFKLSPQRLFNLVSYMVEFGTGERYQGKVKGTGETRPGTDHEGLEEEYTYSYTLSLTWTLDGVGCQRNDPATLPPGKTRYPLYNRLGRPQGRSRRVRKISTPPPGFDPRTIHNVGSR